MLSYATAFFFTVIPLIISSEKKLIKSNKLLPQPPEFIPALFFAFRSWRIKQLVEKGGLTKGPNIQPPKRLQCLATKTTSKTPREAKPAITA